MAPYCSSMSEQNQQHGNPSEASYDLYGVINHRGSAWFGHYTSYAKLLCHNDAVKTDIGKEDYFEEEQTNLLFTIGWRYFDDQHVSTLKNIKDIVQPDAYVLFYRHRNLSVNFPIPKRSLLALSEPIYV